MKRRLLTITTLAALGLLLFVCGAHDTLFSGQEQYERKRCCQRLRICALELQALAEKGRAVPATLSEWAAQDPYIAGLFRGDIGCYELLSPSGAAKDAADPASTVVLFESKPTHVGTLHALFADFHLDAAPVR